MSTREASGARSGRDTWDLTRLKPGDLIGVLAALMLLFVLATDWYGTRLGDAARRIEQTAETDGSTSGEIGRKLEGEAVVVAEREEKNAWQASGALDRAILLVALASIALALIAAAQRARGRHYPPPLTPSALMAAAALLGIVLIVARVIDRPGLDAETTLRPGIALGAAGFALVAFGAGRAMRAEARDAPPAGEGPRRRPRSGRAPRGDAAAR